MMKKLKKLFVGFCTLLVLGGASYGLINKAIDQSNSSKARVIEKRYHKLANGTVVYEEFPGKNVEDIEPAAGDNQNDGGLHYRYDALTQTYRMQRGH